MLYSIGNIENDAKTMKPDWNVDSLAEKFSGLYVRYGRFCSFFNKS